MRLSSSLSWMIPSISVPRSSSDLVRERRVGVALGPGPARVVEHAARQQPDQALQVRARAAHGQVQRCHRVAEGVPARAQGLLEVAPLVVDLRDDDGAGHPHRGTLVPQHPGQAVHALGGGDSEEGRVRRTEPGPQVAGEVGVTGGIQQVHLDPGVDERGDGEVDRALLPDLHLVEVADGRAVLHPAHPLDGTGRAQQRLDQRCLA